MLYTDLEALANAVLDLDDSDVEGSALLKHLIAVYFDALNNPPHGVVGVGAITYAQYELISAQLDTREGEL